MSATPASQPICPLTGHPATPYARKQGALYLRDRQSGVIFLAKRPNVDQMAVFVEAEYESGAYRDYVAARDLKLATARQRLALIAPHVSGTRLLDVGCASGFFLEAALDAGFEPIGIELSTVAIGMAAPRVQPLIIHGDVNTLIGRQQRDFDIVSAFDIVEHTQDPRSFVADISRALRPGGLLVISTPDTGHWLRPLMGAAWPMLQPDQHTYLFSRGAMEDLLRRAGFEVLIVQTAHKVLTIEYLFGQLRQTNPWLARWLDRAKSIIPRATRQAERTINIGEMFVCARKA
jgi:2-polyprenyl-3-methyl-5-hydroxy-6-metoxy-1,4-benzoquinol methylase